MSKIRYQVKWCSSIPLDENGGGNHEKAAFETREFTIFAAALEYARAVLSDDAYDCVKVEKQEYVRNDDIFEHGGRIVMEWISVDRWIVDDNKAAPDHVGL